jgi:hypothetical protein
VFYNFESCTAISQLILIYKPIKDLYFHIPQAQTNSIQNKANIQNDDFTFIYPSISASQPCIFAIFKPTNFGFLEDYIRIKDPFGFSASFSMSSEIELGLGLSQINPIPLKFRVVPMIYCGKIMKI